VMKLSGNRCQCTRCGTYFNRVSTFDKHRIGRMPPDSWSPERVTGAPKRQRPSRKARALKVSRGLDMICGSFIIRLWVTPTRRWNR
jgi:hypothetical protein